MKLTRRAFIICLTGVAAASLAALADAVVTFPDPGLEAAIREATGKPAGDIYDSDLVGLSVLWADGRSISDLTGIEYCTALTELYLSYNKISDLTPLAGLTALTRLEVGNNQISDLAPLAGLTALTRLEMVTNQISDLAPLAGLTVLTTLDLGENQISDLTPLAGLTTLAHLTLWYNQISDLVPLAGMTVLTHLYLSVNQISDLTPLAGLTALPLLGLWRNQISDLTPLAGLTALTHLEVGDNQISDPTPLAGLTALTHLYVYSNQISDLTPLAGLTVLKHLYLHSNQISDLTPLAGLTALEWLRLYNNQISDINPLVLNAGIDSGDTVDVRSNYLCLDCPSGKDWEDVNLLLARGVSVEYDPQTACWPESSAAVFRVDPCGNVMSDASFYGPAFTLGAADVAEWVQVAGPVEAGDVLELDPSLAQSYREAQTPCSDLVAGVVSTQPGVTLGASTVGPQQALLALSGIVPVKVTNEGGPIQPGDLLVSSSTPGYAMRWAGPDPCPCALVGKALESMTDERGVISVLLTAH